MKRLACVAAGLALLGVGAALAADPTIKEIMTKAHKGGNSILANLKKDLAEDEPNWDDIQQESKELVQLGTALGKNTPPKGDQASWGQLTKAYLANAQALQSAADSKNKAGATAALGKLQGSCMGCHRAHRGM